MAVTLSHFQFNWKALNSALNTLVDAVNRNAPLEGEGITLDEKGQQGVSINTKKAQGPSNPSSDPSGGGVTAGVLQQLVAFDLTGNPIVINVYTDGNNPAGATLQWTPVDVVTPPGCTPVTINVLTKPSSG